MDAEVTAIGEGQRRRRRDRPDPELERRAVGDELRDVLADPPFDVADGFRRPLEGRLLDLDREVDVIDVDEALAECPRSAGFSWAMTVVAARMAACIASTDTLSEQNPCRSGGVTLIRT